MNTDLLRACVWAMDLERHLEHIEILTDYEDAYAYAGIVWLKTVWERDTRNPLYLTVLQGRADVEVLREQVQREKKFVRRLLQSWKKNRLERPLPRPQ